jgi:hypothetical protein
MVARRQRAGMTLQRPRVGSSNAATVDRAACSYNELCGAEQVCTDGIWVLGASGCTGE